MATLIRMAEYRDGPGRIHFERGEITRLLSLYAVRVAAGEWRDYAIDVLPDGAAFAVFRNTAERPLYVITKTISGPRGARWSVTRGDRRVARDTSLDGALAALAGGPRPVSDS